jgi:O-antigen/teichoic acid export membrane protein
LKNLFSDFTVKIPQEYIKYTLVLFIGSLIYIGGTSTDIFMIRYFLNTKNVGLFTAAIMIPKTIQVVFLSKLQIPFLYYFSHNLQLDKEKIVHDGTLMIGSITGLISLSLLYQSDNIIGYIFGSQYLDSILVLKIFSIHFFLVGFLTFSGVYFNAKDKPSYGLYIGLIGLFINISLDFILIPEYGINGAAIAHIIALIIQAFIYLYILRIKYNIGLSKLLFMIFIFNLSYIVILFYPSIFWIILCLLIVILVKSRFLDIKLLRSFLRKSI